MNTNEARMRAALHLLEAAVKVFYSRKRTKDGQFSVVRHEFCCIVLSDMNACGRAKDHFKRTFKPRGVASEGAWFGDASAVLWPRLSANDRRNRLAAERRNFETRVWALLLAAASVE